MSTPRFQELAASLVNGAGTPRSREQVIAEVAATIESVHQDGRAVAYPEARVRAMREVVSALAVAQQALAATATMIERDLGSEPPR